MIRLARRFLNLLQTFGIYTRHYKLVYTGDITSSNKLWSSPHWSVRSKLKKEFNEKFTILLLEAKVRPMSELSLFVFYHSKHDCDNLSSLSKILMDTVKEKYLPDDNTKFYKSTHTFFDNNLPKGTVEFHLIGK